MRMNEMIFLGHYFYLFTSSSNLYYNIMCRDESERVEHSFFSSLVCFFDSCAKQTVVWDVFGSILIMSIEKYSG